MSFDDIRLSSPWSRWRRWSPCETELKPNHEPGFLPLVETLKAKHKLLWSSMSFSQQKKLLPLLEQMKPEEQDRLLRVMNQLKDHNTTSLLSFTSYPCNYRLLNLLTHLKSIDRSNLLRLLESMGLQEQKKLISVMRSLEVSEQVELLGILGELEALEQQILLNVLNTTYFYKNVVLKLMKSLPPFDRSRLLSILDGLDSTDQDGLLKVLEHLSRHHELVETIDRPKQEEKLRLLSGVDSPVTLSKIVDEILGNPLRISEIIDSVELQQQQLERVLDRLGYLQDYKSRMFSYTLGVGMDVMTHSVYDLDSGDVRFLFKADLLKNLLQREGCLSLDRSSLLQCLNCLDPLERKQLPRFLSILKILTCRSSFKAATFDEKEVDVYSMLSDAYDLLKQMEYESLQQQLLLLFVCLLSICLSEADPQGGFRNLLLDGWWLEFWEIILLAAGDVERNPGPRRMTDEELCKIDARVLEKDTLFDVYDAVYDCRPKWRNLCLALRVSSSNLSTIDEKRRGDPDTCLQDGLSLWLQGHYNADTHGPPTWRMLVDAVANSAGGDDHALAVEIAKNHKGTHAQTVLKPAGDDHGRDREESRCGHQHSAAFSKMYGAITRSIGRSLPVDDLRQFLCFFSHPHSPSQRYIEPSVYMGVESTRDILDQLYPVYVNPGNIYLLEEIVELSNSRQCRRILRKYTNQYQ